MMNPYAPATSKQLNYAGYLARKAGYRDLNHAYGKSKIGGLNMGDVSHLIDTLKAKLGWS